ncbi:hypothetical protein D9615_000569 [Tricholomella constricta]|uniref:Yeast cell wall synthesis Kre9/Knh1-like N-terminal domain-containing protein n=1 Tax=Tricholomella constricta TaxID=117010 RepID=A0A8H5HR32_9AGAR|nr:hypothetical protein D9615_000569 [Tricholomella constricta]
MRFSTALCLSFIASVLAYEVTEPSASKGWSDSGAQTLAWTRVNTDPANFTVVLTNVDRSALPQNNQVLAAQVDGSLETITVNPPSGGWPSGGSFRINFVKDTNNLDAILAQSNEFDIEASTETTTSRTSNASTTRTLASNTAVTGTSATTTATSPPTTETDDPLATNAGPKSFAIDASLVSLFAALSFFLA